MPPRLRAGLGGTGLGGEGWGGCAFGAGGERPKSGQRRGHATFSFKEIRWQHRCQGRRMGIVHDLRYAGRTLRRNPGFTALAILLLALGMGASTAIFNLLDSVLFKSLAVKEPGRLVLLTDPAPRGVSVGTGEGPQGLLTYGEFVSLRQHMTSFSHMFAADSSSQALNARIDGGVPEEIRLRLASGDYFGGLGVPPVAG